MNIKDLGTNYKILSAPDPTPQQNIKDFGGNYSVVQGGNTQQNQQSSVQSNLGTQTAQLYTDAANKISNSVTEGAKNFNAIPNPKPGDFGTVLKKTGVLLETGLGVASGFGQAVFAPINAIVGSVLNKTGLPTAIANTPIAKTVSAWAQVHPRAAKNLMDAITVAGTAVADVGGSSNPLNTNLGTAAKDVSTQVGKGLTQVKDAFAARGLPAAYKGAFSNVKTSVTDWNQGSVGADVPRNLIYNPDGTFTPAATDHVISDMAGKIDKIKPGLGKQFTSIVQSDGQTADSLVQQAQDFIRQQAIKSPELTTIQGLISPKLNAKEIKLAVDQGRIVPGQDPTLLNSGTPDTIIPSDQTINASQVIQENIPNASKLKPPQLYTALDNKIGEIASKLQPEMQRVPITDQIVQKITDAWNALKSKQLSDPYMSGGANLEKLQAQFENNFLKTSGSNTLDDLWNTAKAYDASVPAGVKSASSLSSDALQAQKSIWLQNRSILKSAINDASTGLGNTSQKAFADMTGMYNAQKGIQSGFKLATEGAPSGISKFLQTPKGKILKYGTEAVVGDKILKRATGIGI